MRMRGLLWMGKGRVVVRGASRRGGRLLGSGVLRLDLLVVGRRGEGRGEGKGRGGEARYRDDIRYRIDGISRSRDRASEGLLL